MRKVPVRMPTKSEEITSLISKAITMATKGGKIDIHKGIDPATGPKIFSSTMPKTKAISTERTIRFLFIGIKCGTKIQFFEGIPLSKTIWSYFCKPNHLW